MSTQSATGGRIQAQSVVRPRVSFLEHFNVTRELAITQFKLKYTGSVLGYLWSLVKPMMIFGVMYAVFDLILHVGRGVVNFPLQLLVGVVLWTFFAETTTIAVSSIIANGSLVQRAFFPRSILVIANSASAALTFVINLTLIVVIAGPLGHLDLGLRSLLAMPLIVELYILILGAALLLSSLFVFFRDLGHIWEILLQVLFYASGIVFPIATATATLSSFRYVLLLNPIAQVVEDVRHVLVTPTAPWTAQLFGTHGAWQVVFPIGVAFALFGVGALVFRRLSPRFAENL